MPALCGGELPCELSSSNEHVHTNDQASLRQTPTASPMDEDLVITGIGGRYPDCDHIQEFWDKLVAGVELSSVDDRRWPVGYLSLPHRSGKIRDISKCDYEFFKMTQEEANYTDVQMRLLLETTYEAIADAGIDPATLRGSNTAIFAGICYDDTGTAYGQDESTSLNYLRLSIQRVMRAFDFRGTASSVDTACASSFTAFFQAFYSLRAGLCDQAIVCGAAVNLRPTIALGFNNLRMTSDDGRSKCMDASADGYGRSEAVVSILLQRSSEAKRIYATIVKTKTNTDGYKSEGITFPSIESQFRLMSETQREAGIHPHDMKYVEAHMTGTPAGDSVESESIRRTFCVDGRKDALKVGCLKSNLGHTEAASGVSAISKVCLAFQNRELPPNLNLKVHNPNIEGLKTGILDPVTTRQKFEEKLVGISSFGFGGCNVYSILKAHEKEADVSATHVADKLPRVINVCGRTTDAVEHVFDYIDNNRDLVTKDFLALLSGAMKTNPSEGMNYRGYMLLDENKKVLRRDITRTEDRRPLWFVFSGLAPQWQQLCVSLMEIETFATSINKLTVAAINYDLNLKEALFEKPRLSLLEGVVATVAVQVAFVDLLSALNLRPDGLIGQSLGEIACAYADGCLTTEQTIAVAVQIGKALRATSQETLNWHELGLHSDKVAQASQAIRDALAKIIPKENARMRSSKWLSSSIAEEKWHEPEAHYLTPQYFANCITSTEKFGEALKYIPKNAAVIEISPASLLRNRMQTSLGPDVTIIPMLSNKKDSLLDVAETVGLIYETGHNPKIEVLYPVVEFPVARGTLSISPLIKWDHSKSCTVTKHPEYYNVVHAHGTQEIDIMNPQYQYLEGHVIDGRNLCPAIEYLRAVWKQVVAIQGSRNYLEHAVEFKKVRLFRAIILSRTNTAEMFIRYVKDTGEFEVSEGGTLCCAGYIFLPENPSTAELEDTVRPYHQPEALPLNSKDIYKEFRVRGYDYQSTFQGLVEASSDGTKGRVKWLGQWVSFTDSMLQLAILGESSRNLRIPTYIEYIKCDINELMANIEACKDEMGDQIVDVVYDANIGVGASKGIVVMGLKTSEIARRQGAQQATVESYDFVPFESEVQLNKDVSEKLADYVSNCETMLRNLEEGTSTDNARIKDLLASGSKSNSLLRVLHESLEACAENADDDESVARVFTANAIKTKSIDTLRERLAQSQQLLAEDLLTALPIANERLTRHQLDIVIENAPSRRLTVVEANTTSHLLCDRVSELLDANHIQSDYSVLHPAPKTLSAPGASLVDWSKTIASSTLPSNLQSVDLVILKDATTSVSSTCTEIGNQVHNLKAFLESAYAALKPNGFALLFVRTSITEVERRLLTLLKTNEPHCAMQDLNEIGELVKRIGFLYISAKLDKNNSVCSILLRKPNDIVETNPLIITIRNSSFEWVDQLKKQLVVEKDEEGNPKSTGKKQKVWLAAEDSPNGLIGLINCLRREPGYEEVRGIINVAAKKNGPIKIPQEVLEKDLVISVYQQGTYGTFRHTTIEDPTSDLSTETTHAYADIKTKGDMSSFRWLENDTKHWAATPEEARTSPNESLCQVYYAPLNFKDVMIASGRISNDAYPAGGSLSGGLLGMEFSGRDTNGNRVMGYTVGKAIATEVVVLDPLLLLPVPSHWTLAQASTVPVVYSTVYYGLLLRGQMKKGESILIHAGAGGVGQAAIHVCQNLGVQVFTTCGSEEKRNFLMKEFGLRPNQIANSRDETFEEHIMRETEGRGVDIVLNSLSESKLKASIRCLSEYGRFVEIGKYDIIVDSALDISSFGGNKSFQTTCLAHLDMDAFVNRSKSAQIIRRKVYDLLCEGIVKGEVKPIKTHLFKKEQIEDAFRFMASGKHIGKVVIKVRDEEMDGDRQTVLAPMHVNALKQTFFHPKKSYIVTGGIGGMGLELAYWMTSRGCKNLVLTSRTGIKDTYQEVFVRRLRESAPMQTVVVSTADFTTEKGAAQLLAEATALAPLGGIFNLAMVLKDATLENQTPETFSDCCAAKVSGTINLDKLTRTGHPHLEHFVCFSSVVAGRGNGGQTNYGFANSVMERVCEDRQRAKLPGLAIQWGAIGDVGIVAELLGGNDVVIAGTSVPQRMPSCLETLDQILLSKHSVVSSIVKVSTKKISGGGKGDLLGIVSHILGIKDPAALDPNSTLSELGMDSLMAIEIKQGFEREYDLVLSSQEIRNMKVKELKDLEKKVAETMKEKKNKKKETAAEEEQVAEPTVYA